ncbi:MAG: class II aldolase/adducin family protein [Planctomycetes bacterium]|nr:class II aldolase/adducin family protein [Planctomycetota bacterium]
MPVIDDLRSLGRMMVERGLVAGPGGNVSARDGKSMVCSPSGYDVDRIADGEWSVIDIESGKQTAGPRATSEWEMHLFSLRARPEMNVVCHAHPPIATGIISGGMEILPWTPDFVAYVDSLYYLPFVKPSSTELALRVQEGFKTGASGVALRNHGVVTLGRNWRDAFAKMLIVEDTAKTQMAAIIAGKPRPLTDAEVAHVRGMEVEAYRRKILERGGA